MTDSTSAGLRLAATLTMKSLHTLPLHLQAEVCDGLAAALTGHCPGGAKAAAAAADALRRADVCQLTFREILAAS